MSYSPLLLRRAFSTLELPRRALEGPPTARTALTPCLEHASLLRRGDHRSLGADRRSRRRAPLEPAKDDGSEDVRTLVVCHRH